MRLTLLRSEPLTPDVDSFWFSPDKPVRFIAGQYIDIQVPHSNMDNRGNSRWMTIASAPHENEIQIVTRFEPKGGSTYKAAFRKLQPGTTLYASEPIGDFVLPKSTNIPVTFVAAGIGITPLLSIVKHMVYTVDTRPLQLIYGTRDYKNLIGHNLFRASGIDYIPILSRTDGSWDYGTGLLSGERILQISGPDSSERLFFLSGPEPLTLALIDELYALGIQRHQIVMDYFPGY